MICPLIKHKKLYAGIERRYHKVKEYNKGNTV